VFQTPLQVRVPGRTARRLVKTALVKDNIDDLLYWKRVLVAISFSSKFIIVACIVLESPRKSYLVVVCLQKACRRNFGYSLL
jgi:hypothetical protein